MPLIFSALVLGITGLGDLKSLGRIGLKTLAYTVVVSSIAVVLGLVAGALVFFLGDWLVDNRGGHRRKSPVSQTHASQGGAMALVLGALLYHFGIEWDLTSLNSLERHALSAWVSLHKRIQPFIYEGTLVHCDHPDPAIVGTGLVAADGSVGWYVVASVAASIPLGAPTVSVVETGA